MASFKILLTICIFSVFVPSILGTEFVVGDEKGWGLNFDQTWAQGKEFHVGDTLVFRYPKASHNVMKVDGTAFQQCSAPAGTEAMATGNDTITLSSPGKKWYICGVAKHCESGSMKLAITVLPQSESPAASPSPSSTTPTSAATGRIGSRFYGWVNVVMVGVVLIRMVMF